jgi:hypothetical protein
MRRPHLAFAIPPMVASSCGAAFDHRPRVAFRRRCRSPTTHVVVVVGMDDHRRRRRRPRRAVTTTTTTTTTSATYATARDDFLDALDAPTCSLNSVTETRNALLDGMIRDEGGCGLTHPGSMETFASVAPGTWNVVYAPHMTYVSATLGFDLSVRVSPSPSSIPSPSAIFFPPRISTGRPKHYRC